MLEVEKALQRFAKHVVSRSRANLTRQDKNASRSLYDSLDYEINVSKNSFKLRILMEEYAMFQDRGVRGADPSLVNGVQKAPLSPYRFKNKMPPLKPILDWVKLRKIRLRDEKGKFKKGSYKTVAFLVQRSIYAQGLKPSLFFTRPFIAAFDNLPDDVVEAYGLDLEQFIKFTQKK
ncbi:hypothetical protein [uncultured Mediterranean phage uvMED]|nr:hypothetical protein [uncultured Mediterranean phage uvMED]